MKTQIKIDLSRLLGFKLAGMTNNLAVLTGAKIGKNGGGAIA